jgi:hypothetical protein
MRRSAVLGVILATILAEPSFAEWQRTTKDQSLLALDLPGLSGSREQFLYDQRADYSSETYYASQIAPANYPRGQFYYTILAPDRRWISQRDLDEQWVRGQTPFFEKRQITGLQVSRGGAEDKLRTVRFQVDQSDCIGVSFLIGSLSGGGDLSAGTHQAVVRGYYCSKAGESLNDESIRDVLSGIQIGRTGTSRVGLATPRADAPSASLNPAAANQNLPVAIVWEGLASPIAGTISFKDEGQANGSVEVATNGFRCNGSWRRTGQMTTASREGFWTVTCDNGLGATGKFKSPSADRGNGEGIDSAGRQVKFSFGR